MIALHRNHGDQATTHACSQRDRVTVHSGRRPVARESQTATRPDAASHLNWELLAIWSFVAFSFAALFFCLYVIFAKCQVTWPL